MVAESKIAISTTKHLTGTDAAPFLSYLGRLVSLNAPVLSCLASLRVVGLSEITFGPEFPTVLDVWPGNRNLSHYLLSLGFQCL